MAVAVNCCVAPRAIDGAGGATKMAFSVGVTVKPTEAVWPASAAEMAVVPVPVAFTNPAETLATEAFEDDQVAAVVTSIAAPLLYLAVACNCWVAPVERVMGPDGVMESDKTVVVN